MHWLLALLRDLWRLFFPDPDYERRHWEEVKQQEEEEQRRTGSKL